MPRPKPPPRKAEKVFGITLAARADCEGCAWSIGPGRESRTRAKEHVRSTGHEVRVVIETTDVYRAVPITQGEK